MTFAPKRQRRKEARPSEIMAAGLKAFSERGFAATRLEDVAEAAGVSKATIYLYFDNKADLLKAILREVVSPRMGELEAIIHAFDGSTPDLLRAIYGRASAVVSSDEVRPILKLIVSEAGNFPDIAKFYWTEIASRGLHTFAQLIERGIERGEFRRCDPVATAQSIIFPLLMNALATEVFGPMPEFNTDKFHPNHLEFVLRGLAANGET
ncbi:MAG: TetR/AcrR family transcriptional regulator [Parvibaculum sp.]|nr:TetR/AcrR family transcriptional regulator [Parvibaculum sp.]